MKRRDNNSLVAPDIAGLPAETLHKIAFAMPRLPYPGYVDVSVMHEYIFSTIFLPDETAPFAIKPIFTVNSCWNLLSLS